MTSTLLRAGHVYSPADPRATAMLVTDSRIAWIGADGDAPAADTVVDLDGALVTPAFVDAHVHATDTGLVRSAEEVLDAVSARAKSVPEGGVLLGFGWDESTWVDRRLPDAGELERASGGRLVLLSQKSMHSALCSSAMLEAGGEEARAAAGYDESGWLRRAAHHVVRGIALGSIGPAQRHEAQTAALRAAAALGIASIH